MPLMNLSSLQTCKYLIGIQRRSHTSSQVNPGPYGKSELNEPWHEISNNVVCATSKGSDQPACAYAQPDQSLC